MPLATSNIFKPVNTSRNTSTPNVMGGSTPASAALSNYKVGSGSPALSGNLGLKTSGFAPAPVAPTQPKKSSYTDTMGNSVTHTYDTNPKPKVGGELSPEQKASGEKFTSSANATPQTPSSSMQGSKPSGVYQTSTTGLLGAGQDARGIANRAGEQISNIGQRAANAQAGYNTTGTVPVGGGNAAITSQTASAAQQAIASGANMQLSGNQQNIGALSSAGGLTQPQLSSYGQTYYNPEQAGQGGGAGVQPNDPFYKTMQTYAQMLTRGEGASVPSSVTSNPALAAQLQQMATQINPNYNASVAGAQGGSLATLTQQKNTIQSAATGAKNNMALAIDIATKAGINKNVPAVNAIEQAIRSNLTGAESLPAFQAQVNSIQNAYQQMGINPGISDWNNITVDQLSNLSANLEKNINNVVGGIDSQIKDISKTGGAGTTKTGTTSSTGSYGNTWEDLLGD